MAHSRNGPSTFDELEEGEIREEREIDFLIKLEETCQERLKKLLSMQALELKKFKIFKQAREMEFEMNCWKFQKFEILKKGFETHMKTQYRNFIAMQIEARNKEKILKENWVEMAKNGKFETAFFETPIPDSKFRMERFDYESEMKILLPKNGASPNELTPTNPNFRSQNIDEPNRNPNLRSLILDESNSNPNLESKEDRGNKDEMECDGTTLDATNPNPSPKPSLSPNSNSPVSVMPNPNSKSEEALKEDEISARDDTTLNVPNPNSPPIIIQNPNLENDVIVVEEHEIVTEENVQNMNSGFLPVIEHENNANSRNEANISNISQINPPIPPNQVVAQSINNMAIDTALNITPSFNQNAPPVQQPFVPSSSNQNAPPVRQPFAPSSSNQNAPPVQEFPVGDINVAHELFRMISPQLLHENPLQNELVMLHKLCEVIDQKHEQKLARLKAERNIEMEQVKRKYRQVDAELDSECSKGKLTLKRRYETLLRNNRLTQEFHDIYHNAPRPVPSSGSGARPAVQMAARRPPTPNPVASSSFAVQTPVSVPVQNQDSNSQSSASPSTPNPAASSNPAVQMPVSCPVQNQDSNSQTVLTQVQNQNSISQSYVSPATPNPALSSNPAVQTPVSRPVQNRNSNSQMVLSQVQNQNSNSQSILGPVPNRNSGSRFSANRSVSGRGILRAPAPHMKRFRLRPQNMDNNGDLRST